MGGKYKDKEANYLLFQTSHFHLSKTLRAGTQVLSFSFLLLLFLLSLILILLILFYSNLAFNLLLRKESAKEIEMMGYYRKMEMRCRRTRTRLVSATLNTEEMSQID